MRKHIGNIGVDTGLCWIGDPCNVVSQVLDWETFCEKMNGASAVSFPFKETFCEKMNGASAVSFPFVDQRFFNSNEKHEGAGVCCHTGMGDGFFPVYANIHDGLITSVEVVFMETE